MRPTSPPFPRAPHQVEPRTASKSGYREKTSPSSVSNSSSTAAVWPAFSVAPESAARVNVGHLLHAHFGLDGGRGPGMFGGDVGGIGHGTSSAKLEVLSSFLADKLGHRLLDQFGRAAPAAQPAPTILPASSTARVADCSGPSPAGPGRGGFDPLRGRASARPAPRCGPLPAFPGRVVAASRRAWSRMPRTSPGEAGQLRPGLGQQLPGVAGFAVRPRRFGRLSAFVLVEALGNRLPGELPQDRQEHDEDHGGPKRQVALPVQRIGAVRLGGSRSSQDWIAERWVRRMHWAGCLVCTKVWAHSAGSTCRRSRRRTSRLRSTRPR